MQLAAVVAEQQAAQQAKRQAVPADEAQPAADGAAALQPAAAAAEQHAGSVHQQASHPAAQQPATLVQQQQQQSALAMLQQQQQQQQSAALQQLAGLQHMPVFNPAIPATAQFPLGGAPPHGLGPDAGGVWAQILASLPQVCARTELLSLCGGASCKSYALLLAVACSYEGVCGPVRQLAAQMQLIPMRLG